jgi:hypothetical protein
MSRRRCAILLTMLVRFLPIGSAAAENSAYISLVDRGVTVSPQETIKLPKPQMDDGLDAATQRTVVESLLDGRYDWDTFTRKAVVSPILLKIADNDTALTPVGRRVDLYFVAYGSLDKLGSENFLTDQINITAANNDDREGARTKLLTNEELGKRSLRLSQKDDDPRWIATSATLLDKVRISATTQNVKSKGDGSVIVASLLDPKFDNDTEYPNSWRSIATDDGGQRQIGPPQPYAGMGSYVKATRLVEPAGGLFLECHVVFAEPQAWFHGANLLRSKLPIVAQDMVRKFRRNLEKP